MVGGCQPPEVWGGGAAPAHPPKAHQSTGVYDSSCSSSNSGSCDGYDGSHSGCFVASSNICDGAGDVSTHTIP